MNQFTYQGKDPIQQVHVTDAVNEKGTVYYLLQVDGKESSWVIRKRYNQFESLHINFIEVFLDQVTLPELPPKKFKLFESHTSAAFIDGRKVLIENYCRKLLENKKLAHSRIAQTFFSTDIVTHPNAHNTTSTSNSAASSSAPSPTAATDTAAASSSTAASTAAAVHISPSHNLVPPEDCEISTLSIPSTRIINEHVFYVIDFSSRHRPPPHTHWTILRRYNQIDELAHKLAAELGSDVSLPPLPPKAAKLWQNHLEANFIEERRVLLEHYMRKLMCISQVAKSKTWLDFCDPA